MMELNKLEIVVTLVTGEVIIGEINLMGYKRFSDFIEKNHDHHIKLFNARGNHAISGSKPRFLVIPKVNICYYEPDDGNYF